jgi:hypothetical protein
LPIHEPEYPQAENQSEGKIAPFCLRQSDSAHQEVRRRFDREQYGQTATQLRTCKQAHLLIAASKTSKTGGKYLRRTTPWGISFSLGASREPGVAPFYF